MAGFIHNKLEIQFLILYIVSRLQEPVTASQLQELTLIDDGINYFEFSIGLNDLVQTGHLLLDGELYAITPKGRKNSSACESGLPYSVRLRADKEIAYFNQEALRRSMVKGAVMPPENGTYAVELNFSDESGCLMHLHLAVATQAMAEDLKQRFEQAPEDVFTKVISSLYG